MKATITISFAIALAPIVSSGGDTSSLDGLVAEALAGNPEIKVFSAEIVAAKGERRTAGEWQNPEVSGDLGAKIVRDYHGKWLKRQIGLFCSPHRNNKVK